MAVSEAEGIDTEVIDRAVINDADTPEEGDEFMYVDMLEVKQNTTSRRQVYLTEGSYREMHLVDGEKALAKKIASQRQICDADEFEDVVTGLVQLRDKRSDNTI